MNGYYTMLKSSQASKYIKDILIHKAKKRPGTRFFGEAYISSTFPMRAGWYSSYKWLTATKWKTGKNLKNRFERLFYHSLIEYIGEKALSKLQHDAVKYYEKCKIKPVPPDLWLIDKKGNFHFIESKKGNDEIHSGQLEGLALIKKYIKCSISIIHIYPDNLPTPKQLDHSDNFTKIYKSL